MLELAIKAFIAYLLGSVLGSLLVGRLYGGIDIRTQGSGNAGGTNALRTQGKVFAFWVMLIDIGKGVLAAGVLPRIPLAALWGGAAPDPAWLSVACGAAVVVGHVFPLWHGLRGGKGAATLVGVLIVLAPWLLPPVLVVFAAVLAATGYVGLSTLLATAVAPLLVLMLTTGGVDSPLFAFTFGMTVFIAFTHRSNIQRLLAGTENRFEKAMIFKARK